MKSLLLTLTMISLASSAILDKAGDSFQKTMSHYRTLPKLEMHQMRQLTQGFFTVLQLHVLNSADKHKDFSKPGSMGRVLIEKEKHMFSEKVQAAVDGELMGLKGDVKGSQKLSLKVKDILGSARGYFDQVKTAKENLTNPAAAIGGALKAGLGKLSPFRTLEEEQGITFTFFLNLQYDSLI